nr:patatin-like phospholipase family protein [Allomuricauda sp.]
MEIPSKANEEQKEPYKGFEEIALCFSGGGYRAACFSLGTLSFFDKMGLLENVRAISTVSGGTITGIKYAQTQAVGLDFDLFFKDYYKWLQKDELANNAIGHIRGGKVWKLEANKHKRRNPINAFAIEYNRFLGQMTLGDVQRAMENGSTHLQKVVFNATDFTHSLQFRFQNTNRGGVLGNKRVQELGHGLNTYLNKIKLGDILASSSAFPGGFEPIGFPNDFLSKEDSRATGMTEIGLLDGGIIDNQGISSILTSTKEYDLYFLSDVASPYPGDPFKFAQSNTIIKILSYLTSLPALLFSLGLTIYFIYRDYLILTAAFVFLTTVMIGFQYLFYFANKKLKNNLGVINELRIPSRRFGFFVFDRLNSLLKMTTEVFLKTARSSNYESLYDKLWNKIAASTIYQLRCDNTEGRPEGQNQWEKVSAVTGDIKEPMKEVAKKAASFGTTLWFNKNKRHVKSGDHMLDTLVACGEFTACYNLLALMVLQYPNEIKDNGPLYDLYQKCLSLWARQKKDPYTLLKTRLER